MAMLAGGLEFIAPVGTRKVAKEAHLEPDLQSRIVREKAKESLSLRGWALPGPRETELLCRFVKSWPQGVWILNLDSTHMAPEIPKARI